MFSLTPDNTVAVEEAYGIATALPYGLTPKFGRFLSGLGYLNEQHQHTWDFYDAPLVYQAFLGGQYTNNGAAGEVGRADRHVPRTRRRGRQRRRLPRQPAQQERRRRRRRVRARRRRRRREQQLARGTLVSADRREGSRLRADGRRRQRRPGELHRQEPGRHRRLRLEMGAQRQRTGAQLQAAGRVFLATRERRSHLRRRRRARARRKPAATARARAASTCRASTSSCRTGASARATTGSIPAPSTTARTARTSPTRRSIRSAPP